MSNRTQTGQEALNVFIQTLYNELFTMIIKLINNTFNPNENNNFNFNINLFDYPGGNYSTNYKSNQIINSIDDLIYNYLNESVTELLYNSTFTKQMEFYNREQVQVPMEKPLVNPQILTRLLDRKQQLVFLINFNSIKIKLR